MAMIDTLLEYGTRERIKAAISSMNQIELRVLTTLILHWARQPYDMPLWAYASHCCRENDRSADEQG